MYRTTFTRCIRGTLGLYRALRPNTFTRQERGSPGCHALHPNFPLMQRILPYDG